LLKVSVTVPPRFCRALPRVSLARRFARYLLPASTVPSAATIAEPAVYPNAADARRARVGAVIVTYFPDPVGLHALLQRVRPQVAFVIVVDNTPHAAVESADQSAELAASGCAHVALGRNLGLAAAQNRGIERLRAAGCDHVLLLDQDSEPAPDMVDRLLQALHVLSQKGARVAAVGPRWRDRHGGGDAPFVRLGLGRIHNLLCTNDAGGVVECDTLVASGCLIPLPALDVIGPMDERLFIDQIDVEWGIRAQAKGFRLYGVCDAVLHHGIGERMVRVWFAPRRRMPVHAPLRDYYLIRNIVAVFFLRPAPWRWRLLQVVRLPALMLVLVTQMPPRLKRLHFVVRGLIDALRGRLGPATFT
jgi:rhamnosyltransferase